MARTDDQVIPDIVGLVGASEILGISRQAVHKMATAGQLAGRQIDGGTWVFRRAMVEVAAGPVSWDSLLPRWLVPEHCGSPPARAIAGIGVSDDQAAASRGVWEELLVIGARNPGLALMLGASMAAPFLAIFGCAPFWVVATGPKASGKSSALAAAAAVVGDPSAVVAFSQHTPAYVRSITARSLLPTYLEDSFTPELVHMTTVGGKTAMRDGTPVKEPASRSVVFSTAEVSPYNRDAAWSSPAIANRVVAISRPLGSADDAHDAAMLARQAFGWPLEWLRTAAADSVRFEPQRELFCVDAALRTPQCVRVLAHLAAAMSGARVLETLVGVECGLTAAALDASNSVLRDVQVAFAGV